MKSDIVIFGATGFTGMRVVEELARGGSAKYAGISWAVAGRSESKLLSVLSDISSKADVDLSGIKVIIADVSDYSSLKMMCDKARVVLNCCGPYRLYGEPVVRAAVEAKTHYLDITGEEDFIGTIQIKYDDEARRAGVYVISACGFDSIPNDMGVVYLEKNFRGTLNSVESYLSFSMDDGYEEAWKSGFLNIGTWESVVYVVANFFEVLKLRRKLHPKNLPTLKPKQQRWFPIHKQNGKLAVPIASPDGSIVNRTQHRLFESTNKRPVQFQPYVTISGIFFIISFAIVLMFIGVLSQFKFGRNLLLKYPEWFSFGLASKQGPTQAVRDNTHFEFELIGRGWKTGQDIEVSEPRKTVVAKISGKDPAYWFTALALVQSAVVILTEKHKMPSMGGVYSSGAAFWDTSLVANLQKNNVKFEIIQ